MRFARIFLFVFQVLFVTFAIRNMSASAMGGSAASSEIRKACIGFKDALQSGKVEEIQPLLSESFKQRHADKINAIEFFQQPSRLLNRLIASQYRKTGPLILKAARFQVLGSAHATRAICKVSHNGENEEPEMYTIRELEMVFESDSWKVDAWKAKEAW